jgi:hypothetical protein
MEVAMPAETTAHIHDLADTISRAVKQYMRDEGLTLLLKEDVAIIEQALALAQEEFVG